MSSFNFGFEKGDNEGLGTTGKLSREADRYAALAGISGEAIFQRPPWSKPSEEETNPNRKILERRILHLGRTASPELRIKRIEETLSSSGATEAA